MTSYAEAGMAGPIDIRWSRVAQASWLGLTLLVVLVVVFRVRELFNEAQTICVMPSCQTGEVTAAQAHWLLSLGLPRAVYGGYIAALFSLANAVFFGVAGIVMSRQPRDRIAVFTGFTLVLFAGLTVGNFNEPAPGLPSAVQLPVSILALTGAWALVLLLYVLPDGRFVPWWPATLIIPWELQQVGQVLAPDAPFSSNVVGVITLLPALCAVFGAQIYRYRRVSDQTQRQQTKWVVYAFALALIGAQLTILLFGTDAIKTNPILPAVAVTLLFGFLMIMPLGIGFAILRYRLWDIDILINRTLLYGALTALVVGLYILIVTGLGAVFRTQGNIGLSLLATALVAVLFHPLHGYLQRGVNHLLYGERDEPFAVVSRLGEQLERTLTPDAVLPAIVHIVAQALKLPYAAISLRRDDRFILAATVGRAIGDPLVLPLLYQGETHGQLILGRRPGEAAFSPSDRRLLDDLARQAGVAAYAVRLTADLQRSRERLVTAREEERRRLRRDLHDGLGPALATMAMQSEAARDLLSNDPAQTDALLSDLTAQLQTATADIRLLVHELRPPALDDLGLIRAVGIQINRFEQGGLRITLDAPDSLPALSAAVEVATYRIVLEALNNVVRHAEARACCVRLFLDETAGLLSVEIRDDGKGLPDGRQSGVGLASMQERAAELGGVCRVEGGETGGTYVHAVLPVALDGLHSPGSDLQER